MGRAELAVALKQKGEAEVKAIWQQVEAEVDRYRQQRQQEVARQSEDTGQQADRSAQKVCLQVDWRITKAARALRLKALHGLDKRMWKIACKELEKLGAGRRKQCLEQLLDEVPSLNWETVTVHPDDVAVAQARLPGSRINIDVSEAGLIVETEAGKVRIDNSLKTRLGNRWKVLVGGMLVELEGKIGAQP